MMELSTGIITFSHLLKIKDKLLSKESVVVHTKDEKEFHDKYCSIYMEHFFNPAYMGNNKKEEVVLVLAKRADFTVPIWHISWVILDTKTDVFKPSGGKLPDLLLVGDKGYSIVTKDIENILKLHVENLRLKGRKLKKALNTLSLQCTYADGHNVRVPAQQSLKDSLYILLSKTGSN